LTQVSLVLAIRVQVGLGEALQLFAQMFERLAPEVFLEKAAYQRGAEVRRAPWRRAGLPARRNRGSVWPQVASRK